MTYDQKTVYFEETVSVLSSLHEAKTLLLLRSPIGNPSMHDVTLEVIRSPLQLGRLRNWAFSVLLPCMPKLLSYGSSLLEMISRLRVSPTMLSIFFPLKYLTKKQKRKFS